MNFSLAREIYGLTPWFVDSHSLPGLLGVLNTISILTPPDVKYNTPEVLDINSHTRIITDEFELKRSDEDFEGIAIININGPITKNSGASSLGMKEISETMLRIHRDSRIKAFIVVGDSGGGSTNAIEIMVDAITEVRKTKIVDAFVPKGGMAASACYAILAACRSIYSESKMNIVGSAGTMIEFTGRKANTEDDQGVKHIRLYATKSTLKNKGFEEALNNDNYKILTEELIDPINENILKTLVKNRPLLRGTDYDTGNTKFSKDAIGTFIDGILTFDKMVNNILKEPSIKKNKSSIINNQNPKGMTKQELLSKHPELYKEVFNLGVTGEKDRTGAWMAHIATDPKAVIEGIESDKAITSAGTQKMIVKQASKQQLSALQVDSAGNLITEEAKKKGKEDTTEVDAFYAGIDAKLNLTDKED